LYHIVFNCITSREHGDEITHNMRADLCSPVRRSTASKRMTLPSDAPAMSELGYKGMEADTFGGEFASSTVPKPILTRLHGNIMNFMSAQDFCDRMAAIAMVPVGNTLGEITAQAKTYTARGGKSDTRRWYKGRPEEEARPT
jgi:hypothetical protein